MRTRLVKPGFFTSESLGELAPLTRLLFIGLLCAADKEGRLLDRPRQIKAQLLPYDECDIDAALESLKHAGHILRYRAHHMQIIQVVNFSKHQTLTTQEKTKTVSELPPYRTSSELKLNSKRTSSVNKDKDKDKDKDTVESSEPAGVPAEEPDFTAEFNSNSLGFILRIIRKGGVVTEGEAKSTVMRLVKQYGREMVVEYAAKMDGKSFKNPASYLTATLKQEWGARNGTTSSAGNDLPKIDFYTPEKFDAKRAAETARWTK